MHSNRYTFLYAVAISMITAVILAFASEGLRPRQEANIELDKKTSLLRSVRVTTTERDSIEAIYRTRMQEVVVTGDGEIKEGVTSDHIVLKDE